MVDSQVLQVVELSSTTGVVAERTRADAPDFESGRRWIGPQHLMVLGVEESTMEVRNDLDSAVPQAVVPALAPEIEQTPWEARL